MKLEKMDFSEIWVWNSNGCRSVKLGILTAEKQWSKSAFLEQETLGSTLLNVGQIVCDLFIGSIKQIHSQYSWSPTYGPAH